MILQGQLHVRICRRNLPGWNAQPLGQPFVRGFHPVHIYHVVRGRIESDRDQSSGRDGCENDTLFDIVGETVANFEGFRVIIANRSVVMSRHFYGEDKWKTRLVVGREIDGGHLPGVLVQVDGLRSVDNLWEIYFFCN